MKKFLTIFISFYLIASVFFFLDHYIPANLHVAKLLIFVIFSPGTLAYISDGINFSYEGMLTAFIVNLVSSIALSGITFLFLKYIKNEKHKP